MTAIFHLIFLGCMMYALHTDSIVNVTGAGFVWVAFWLDNIHSQLRRNVQ